MAIYYVFQNQTYKQERKGGYVWSPKFNSRGGRNIGYDNMTLIRKGDFILHSSNTRVRAISIALTDCYDGSQPEELREAKTTVDWDNDGYCVEVKYFDFDKPLDMSLHAGWLTNHYNLNSAFTGNGRGKQQYMCVLAAEHAEYILKNALRLQQGEEVSQVLSRALGEVTGYTKFEFDFDENEKEKIDEFIQWFDDRPIPEWSGKKEKQAITQANAKESEKPKRDVARAADALRKASYLCEYNKDDKTFLRKDGKTNYTEPHHLIPISRWKDFEYSVDVMENIVSLCSHCHNLLHYGRMEDKEPILRKLYDERIEALRKCGLELTFEQLKSYYE